MHVSLRWRRLHLTVSGAPTAEIIPAPSTQQVFFVLAVIIAAASGEAWTPVCISQVLASLCLSLHHNFFCMFKQINSSIQYIREEQLRRP